MLSDDRGVMLSMTSSSLYGIHGVPNIYLGGCDKVMRSNIGGWWVGSGYRLSSLHYFHGHRTVV